MVRAKYADLTAKVLPKISSNPKGNLESELMSINELLKRSKEKDVSNSNAFIGNRENKAFNIDQVKMCWKQFAFKMKENGLETIYTALTKRDPKILHEIEIHQEFDNQVQVEMMQNHVADFLEYIRSNLSNWEIKIYFDVAKNLDENKRLLTGKDKFNELAKKNANLFSLQKTFNLDIDY